MKPEEAKAIVDEAYRDAQNRAIVEEAYKEAKQGAANSILSYKKERKENAIKMGLRDNLSFGTSPTLKGAGDALGTYIGNLREGKGIAESLLKGKLAFTSGRKGLNQELSNAREEFPGYMLGTDLIGSAITAPLMPIKTGLGAMKVGGALGFGEAIGNAESIPEGALMTGLGSVIGLGGHNAIKRLEGGYEKLKSYFPKKKAIDVASARTGMTEKQIEKFHKDNEVIKNIQSKAKGDYNSLAVEDKIFMNEAIQGKKEIINDVIKFSIKDSPKEKTINVANVLKELKEVRADLNPKKPGPLADIDEMIEHIEEHAKKFINPKISTDKFGKPKVDLEEVFYINLQEANWIREDLGKVASGMVIKEGKHFAKDHKASRAASQSLSKLFEILDKEGPPGFRFAIKELRELHLIEEQVTPNLTKVHGPDGSYFAAGSGTNQRAIKDLERIGKFTGENHLERAENLAAARAFDNPSTLPQGEKTGFVDARMLAGFGAGAYIAHENNFPEIPGATIGAALTSPAALKALINGIVRGDKAAIKGFHLINNPKVKSFIIQSLSKEVNNEAMKQRLNQTKRQ